MGELSYRQIFRNGNIGIIQNKNTKSLSVDNLIGHIVKLKTNTKELFAIADLGSPMSFSNEKTAQQKQQNHQTAVFKKIPPEDTARNLACYNGEPIHPKGKLIITIESGGWKIQAAPFIIVDNHKANIIGRNLLPRADCGDRDSEWVRDLFTAHMNNEKIAEDLLAQTRTPQEAYEYAIRRKKRNRTQLYNKNKSDRRSNSEPKTRTDTLC